MSVLSFSSNSTNEDAWSHARLAEEGVAYRVVNVLGSGFVKEPIDIKKLALLVRNADYAPRGFGALVMRFQTPRATVLLYRSGKFVVIGATSVVNAKLAAEKLISILKKVSFPCDSSPFVIRNVVGSTDVCFKIRLEGLARDHVRFSTVSGSLHARLSVRQLTREAFQYEPELFPGLIYRMLRPKCTMLIFISGKLVITGCESPDAGENALGTIYPVLLQYRLRDEYSEEEDEEQDTSDSMEIDL
ncbi:hypothetical protein CCR75_004878 [Bremia lactucae]|uniref:TATA-box-binding protein n=1 Tax=Bremia lactucae TaxID=4779 RepID=A0A976IHM6_BRELC|nr:hypothetical protein CCR75_004878 [Bremia lactucae]